MLILKLKHHLTPNQERYRKTNDIPFYFKNSPRQYNPAIVDLGNKNEKIESSIKILETFGLSSKNINLQDVAKTSIIQTLC